MNLCGKSWEASLKVLLLLQSRSFPSWSTRTTARHGEVDHLDNREAICRGIRFEEKFVVRIVELNKWGVTVDFGVLSRWAGEVAERLVARGETIAVAESSSGGLISAALLAVPGASRFYQGGVVFYTIEGLDILLGDATDLDLPQRGACEEMARFLAAAVKAKLHADWGVGETGASGPTPSRYGNPPGHTWVSCAGPDGLIRAENVLTGDDNRAANMEVFAARALAQLAAALA